VTAIKKNLGNFAAIIALILIAGGVSLYIVQQQRLRIPFLEPKPFKLKAEFSTAQAVVAGQGQTVRVAGVRIGDIGGVELKDGRAVIKMDIDEQYKDLVHTNATALLRPKTGLKDMFIDLEPGGGDAPVAKEGFTVPISATQPDVNPDEILSVLDTDTRDYLKLLLNGAGRGLEGRGGDLRDLLARFEPTHRDLARVNGAVATRRRNLRHLVTSLNVLSKELASRDDDLAKLVDSSAAVFDAFASEEGNVSSAVRELPGTLRQTTDTLGRVETFAELLGPTTEKLRPAARALDPANEAVRPFAREAAPQLRESIRPFVRESRPFVRDLRPAATRLSKSAPDLTQVFVRFNHFLNLLGYNKDGREGPEDGDRQEGYLFWLAWLNHSATQLFSTSDAHGVFRPVTLAAPCATLAQVLQQQPELEFTSVLTPLVTDSAACNGGDSGGVLPDLPVPSLPNLPSLPDLPAGKKKEGSR
jgi:phospholipid/cholesterol/gamma-HCH transport system substrate-binding protein